MEELKLKKSCIVDHHNEEGEDQEWAYTRTCYYFIFLWLNFADIELNRSFFIFQRDGFACFYQTVLSHDSFLKQRI